MLIILGHNTDHVDQGLFFISEKKKICNCFLFLLEDNFQIGMWIFVW